jgi:hypothetical protein
VCPAMLIFHFLMDPWLPLSSPAPHTLPHCNWLQKWA